MPFQFKMPALSPTMEKGSIARWLVQPGDSVQPGDLIAEIETDKATMEVETADGGVILQVLFPEGTEDVPVGTPIALIGEAGEAIVSKPSPPISAAEPIPAASAITPSAPASPATMPPPAALAVLPESIRITPLARRLATILGIDLAGVMGSGARGRITRADLGLTVVGPTPAPPASAPPAPQPFVADLSSQQDIPHERIKLSSMRKTIARRLSESKQQIPHIYLTLDVRLDALLALRGELNTQLADRGLKISVNDLIVKALALALREVPQCNVSFAGDEVLQYRRSDIAMAVAIPNGLITPIVTAADSKSIAAIARETKELAERARAGKLQPAEYQGGTASISNMGMMGIRQFAAVINPPQAMILAVGAAEARSVVIHDELAVATVLSLTGSFDHRAIDGADGAALMTTLKSLLEQPLRIVA